MPPPIVWRHISNMRDPGPKDNAMPTSSSALTTPTHFSVPWFESSLLL
jgi:hypothetical protein